jgi:hypothetical protein
VSKRDLVDRDTEQARKIRLWGKSNERKIANEKERAGLE